MFKFFFAAIFLAHGLLHLLGFAKAFRFGNVQQISSNISKPAGVLWLLVALVFAISFLLWMLQHQHWSFLCLIGIVLSQVLIVFVWKDAKAGTVANLILLAVAWPEYGTYRFQNMVERERAALISGLETIPSAAITENDLQPLPTIVQQWLKHSGVVGKPKIRFVRLKQSGKMKLKPESDWIDFTASQYINPIHPAFVWDTRVTMMQGVFFTGRDKLYNGQGAMQVRLLSLVNLVNEKNNPKINSGTAQRFLAEICWFPSAALESCIRWQELDSLQAKATLELEGEPVEGIFSFRPNGELISFETDRYYGADIDAQKEKWFVNITGYKPFDGYYLPYRNKVSWKLKEGNFHWLDMEITNLEINPAP